MKVDTRAWRCPECQGVTSVYSTEKQPDGTVLRRRQCRRSGCWLKFRTVEQLLAGDEVHVPFRRALHPRA